MKIKYILPFLIIQAAVICNAGLLQPMLWGINKGQSEVNLYGGVMNFKSSQNYQGTNMDFGGSGASFGMQGLMYLSPYLAAGTDISYADNGQGKSAQINGKIYNGEAEHATGLFYVKIQPMPQSPLRIYFPFGAGLDILKEYLSQEDGDKQKDNSTGLALMFGLGMEVETGPYSFVGIEGRYIYTNYFGGNAFGAKHVFAPALLFKAGMRFDGDIFR